MIFKKTKNAITVLTMLILSLTLLGCGGTFPPEWGKKLKYNNSVLLYTSTVTEDEARKLGDYLLETGFFKKDNKGTTQLTKEEDVYQFRMVIKEGADQDMEFLKIVGLFAAQLSQNVFDGEVLEIHLCDKQLETLQVVGFQIEETQESQ